MALVWLHGDALAPLADPLRRRGVEVRLADEVAPGDAEGGPASAPSLAAAALALYGGRGVLVVDARAPAGRAALADQGAALVPVLAVAPPDLALPDGALRLVPQPVEQMAHHISDVLRAPDELRRHPRVPARLPVTVRARGSSAAGSATARPAVDGHTLDLSLYGLRVAADKGAVDEGASDDRAIDGDVSATVTLSDGARVHLVGQVVEQRTGHLALRCHPATDDDLVLWIHVLIAELERSPLHRDLDPFGPLFA